MRVWTALLFLTCLGPSTLAAANVSNTVTIFAAASLTSVVTEIADRFENHGLGGTRTVFGSSTTLARQIEHGAPADIYLSANPDWVTYLETRGRTVTGSRRAVAGNRLVVVVPRDSTVELTTIDQLSGLLADGRLAIADPEAVPAGRYAKEALTYTGQWAQVAKRAVRASDVRAALTWVARGEVASGIVYATDAKIEPLVRIAYRFPAQTHSPIVYEAVSVADAPDPKVAARFLDFLNSPEGVSVFELYSFLAPPPVRQESD